MKCRLCLSPAATVSVFEGEEPPLIRIWVCCQLQVEKNDGLPHSICLLCTYKLESFAKFKLMCEQTDKILRDKECILNPECNLKEEIYFEVDNGVDHHDYFEDFTETDIDNFETNLVQADVNNECLNNVMSSTVKNNDDLNSIEDSSKIVDIIVTKCEKSEINTRNDTRKCENKKQTKKLKMEKENLKKITKKKTKKKKKKPNTGSACPICYEFFPDKEKFIQHALSHNTKIQGFECNICNKLFGSRTSHDRHEAKHFQKTKFFCNLCEKSFSEKGSLSKHIQNVHLKIKPHQCSFCGKLFCTETQCTRHMWIHTGYLKFECDYCGKKVNQKSSLISHIRTHTGERPFTCKICLKSFSLSGTLKSHMLQHTGGNPFTCEICFKGFKQRCNLKSHMKYNHKQV
ncbi:uncharacterized protein LOC143918146 [Arctopsyche grandis]|uniref:uncharacterized protein LOC143918146 n=1 Tax=Arctopsyche grandis TaxID=121162 RepID=UPI00406D905F